MSYGPIELVVIGFPGNKFSGKIMPALEELVNGKIVRILDITFVKKDAKGVIQMLEFNDLSPEEAALFERVGGEIYSVISAEDMKAAAAAMEPNSSAALIIWENIWATRFREAVLDAKGVLIARAHVDPVFMAKALAEIK
jgi:uncharacterized membrane protein